MLLLEKAMTKSITDDVISIKPFEWKYWNALWEIHSHHLAEYGIEIDAEPGPSDLSSPYEQDFHRIDQVYLSGAGNFWIAWVGDTPVGHIGAQDLGSVIELRRMYVRAEYRRRGIGTRLARTLIEHCITHKVKAIELWTREDGPGLSLYEKAGFRVTRGLGEEFKDVEARTGYSPMPGDVRMRLNLN